MGLHGSVLTHRPDSGQFTYGTTQNIGPTGIASSVAFGTAELGMVNHIAVPSIARVTAFGTPGLAGPIIAAGIDSGHAVGTPTILQQLRIILSIGSPPTGQGIPSSVAFGLARIAASQAIQPSAIASSVAFGTPLVQGAIQRLIPPSVDLPRSGVGIPRIAGGSGAWAAFLGGAEATQLMRVGTAQLTSQAVGRWRLTFDMYDDSGTFLPIVGQRFLLTEGANKWFAGCIAEVAFDRVPKSDHQIFFHVTALDKSSICDHRTVKEVTFPAGMDIADCFLSLVANSLDGEGITTNGVPLTLGALDSPAKFNFTSVTNAFDQLATLAGCVWWIDVNCDLQVSATDALPAAPFGISEAPSTWRNLTVKYSLLSGRGYRNIQYAISNLSTSPAGPTRIYTVTLPQAEAEARGFIIGSIVLPFPIQTIVSIKRNGVEQAVHLGTELINWEKTWWYYPQEPFIVPPGASSGAPNNLPDPDPQSPTPPIAGDVIEVEWVAFGNSADVIAADALDPSSLVPAGVTPLGSLATCGSGKYEAVEQVPNAQTEGELAQVAAAVLARSGGVPLTVTFETDRPGLRVGQLLPFDLPNVFAPSKQLLITQVQGAEQPVDMGHGSRFRWQITAVSNLDANGLWVKWFERLVKRTQLALPIPIFAEKTFVLGSGGSLAAGISITNPLIVGQSGALAILEIAAGLAPVDEDLIVTLTRAGQAIATITLPAGSASLHTVDLTNSSSPVFLFEGDLVNANSSYLVVGPSPAPAGNVTLNVKWKV